MTNATDREIARLDKCIMDHESAIRQLRSLKTIHVQQQLIADRRAAIARAEARIDELLGITA